MLATAETAFTSMQGNASEVIARLGLQTIHALYAMNAAHCANIERTQEPREPLGSLIAEEAPGKAPNREASHAPIRVGSPMSRAQATP